MGHESQPRLGNDSDNTCPVEQQALGEMRLHVMPMNVVYDEGEGV
tara:strand:+ start:497 stop:631 length:135 start_codon:yes stop_codon:yes gene_type:complete